MMDDDAVAARELSASSSRRLDRRLCCRCSTAFPLRRGPAAADVCAEVGARASGGAPLWCDLDLPLRRPPRNREIAASNPEPLPLALALEALVDGERDSTDPVLDAALRAGDGGTGTGGGTDGGGTDGGGGGAAALARARERGWASAEPPEPPLPRRACRRRTNGAPPSLVRTHVHTDVVRTWSTLQDRKRVVQRQHTNVARTRSGTFAPWHATRGLRGSVARRMGRHPRGRYRCLNLWSGKSCRHPALRWMCCPQTGSAVLWMCVQQSRRCHRHGRLPQRTMTHPDVHLHLQAARPWCWPDKTTPTTTDHKG